MNIVKKTESKNLKNISISLVIALSITACANKPHVPYKPKSSYLKQDNLYKGNKTDQSDVNGILATVTQKKSAEGITYLPSLQNDQAIIKNTTDLNKRFSEKEIVQLTADSLPLKDYLHYVFGELLQVNYILDEKAKDDNQTVTLNIQHDISKRKLFSLSKELLNNKGYVVRFDEGIYYIHQNEKTGSHGEIAYGYGKSIDHVPNTSATIIQLVPFTYGMQTSLANTLRQILKVKATPDFQRSTLILEGKRKDIIRALEFVNIMDQPVFKHRQIGIYKTVYVGTNELVEKLPALLKQEGISVSAKGQNDQAVSLVSLDRIGALVLFTNSKKLLARVLFWAQQIDKAPSGNQLQYFLYQPQFSRATDLGVSLQALISGGSSLGNSTSAASQNTKQGQVSSGNSSKNKSSSVVAKGENMSMVVDERANALIFSTTGNKYRQLLPLIKRLDVMPKQVMLEVMIAEVKLTDVFKQGVEFALTNQGSASVSGGFNLNNGASGLSYILSGLRGKLTLNLLQTNSHVNVLSRPSLLVRDGVTASITVGDDIPTVGEVVSSPNVSDKTSVVYRKTGVELKVTPTINARGVIIMEIDQKISNQAKGGSSVAGSPIIFERSISTEAVAESGQTIVLGGLISENRTINDNSVPFFSSIPLIGRLFDSTDDTKDKTELVVLVTPRVIESPQEWDDIKAKLAATFSEVNINQ
ncbi:MAG: hypothetical protein COA85_13405 [Robiginitomaculum sp.]|nr:MAG: hypothetical protein COA85_13405 [Robiginitomaculum sp.]